MFFILCFSIVCRSCLIKHLFDDDEDSSKFCPKCQTLIHKAKPELLIRSDPTLQDLVYKLVPGLYSGIYIL